MQKNKDGSSSGFPTNTAAIFPAEVYKKFTVGNDELVHKLVEDHAGWAASIARAVAKSWNLDWQLDGLDGGAYEGLLFCARRYDPALGVPFRAYARRRIHEASTEEARQSKAWKRGLGTDTPEDISAREISYQLFRLFPELREGLLPASAVEEGDNIRSSVRHLLASASMVAFLGESQLDNPEANMQFREVLTVVASLDAVHQHILWGIYYEGMSMRALAEKWGIDELAVIREHKQILQFIFSNLSEGDHEVNKKLKVRPGLRTVAQTLRRKKESLPFAQFQTAALTIGALLYALVVEVSVALCSVCMLLYLSVSMNAP